MQNAGFSIPVPSIFVVTSWSVGRPFRSVIRREVSVHQCAREVVSTKKKVVTRV